MLAFYGRLDDFIPPQQIEEMKAKLAAACAGSKVIVYRAAGHGFFFFDYRPS